MKAIPFYDIAQQNAPLQKELGQAALKVLRSGRYVLGPETEALEKDFAAAHGAKHALGVSSGTSALHLALTALGIKEGDEVITSPFTFIATANVIARIGARPVFADVEPGTLTLDPASVEQRLTGRTRALLPVHIYGAPADMDALNRIAKKRELVVLEDACQAHLAEYKGRKVGALGDAAAFSFYPTKNLGALGDAGLATTDRDDVADTLRLLRNNGSSMHDKYLHPVLGDNARLDEVQAAMLRVKLKKLAAWTEARRRRAATYSEELKGAPVVLPTERPGDRNAWHLYCIRTPHREALAAHLKKNGVATGVYYPVPLHLQPVYRHLGRGAGEFPVAEQAAREVLALPLYPELTAAEIRQIARLVRAFFEG